MLSIRLAVAALVCGAAAPALGQTVAPSVGPSAAVPETAVPATNLDQKSGPLSKKLGETDGVIKPTGDVDPDMHVATPKTGTMPVLKPDQNRDGVAK